MSTACYGNARREIVSILEREWSPLRLARRGRAECPRASARGRTSGWSRRDHGKQSKLNLKLLDILFVRLLYVASECD